MTTAPDLYPELSEEELHQFAEGMRTERDRERGRMSRPYLRALNIELLHVVDHLERGATQPTVIESNFINRETY